MSGRFINHVLFIAAWKGVNIYGVHPQSVNKPSPLQIWTLCVCVTHSLHPTHNGLLFCTQLCVGFFALMWLGELIWPDDTELWDPQKLTPHSSIVLGDTTFKNFLPGHKADRFFKGNTIILCSNPFVCNPLAWDHNYLHFCDTLFPLSSALWVKNNGTISMRSFFIWHLHQFFESDTGGQSMHAGGATSFAENGVAIIQGIGQWASPAWQIYIHKHPVLLQAMLHA